MIKKKMVLLASALVLACILAWSVQLITLDAWAWPPIVGIFVIMLGVFDLVSVPKVFQVLAAIGLFAGMLIRGVAA